MSRAPLKSALLALAMLGGGAWATPQDQRPMSEVIALAEADDQAAQFELAERFSYGTMVPQNFVRAAHWYQRAATAGHEQAQHRLGQLYLNGFGVDQDTETALALLRSAAAGGAAELVFDLAAALETTSPDAQGLSEAATLYQQAAEQGHAEAKLHLAAMLIEGKGIKQDFERARSLLHTLADNKHPKAANNLGLLYVRGDGVAQDYEEAARLFGIAAEQNQPEAIRNLGVLYENGFGVEQSDARAEELYILAASLVAPNEGKKLALQQDPRLQPLGDDPAARAQLFAQAQSGDPVALALAGLAALSPLSGEPRWREAARWFRAAANKGHSPSMVNLGLLHFRGQGVLQDYVQGYMWLSLAASMGNQMAEPMLAVTLQQLTPKQVQEAQRMAVEMLQDFSPSAQ